MKKTSLGDMILEDIKKKILVGEYPFGVKLPNERELAEQYKVSRIPVRQAISVLADEGILEVRRGVGTFVRQIGQNILTDEISAPYLNNQVIIDETLNIRRLVEAEAAKQAAINATDEDIGRIQEALFNTIDEIRKLKARQHSNFFEVDFKFHLIVAEATHNVFFVECIKAISSIVSSHQYWSLKVTNPTDEVISYHTAIFEAIISRDPERAHNSMYKHLSRVSELLVKKIGVPGDELQVNQHDAPIPTPHQEEQDG
ncbi:MAG: FadR/GntR family transcriptional regulator [Acetanaerobacterium sp.]